MFCWKCGKKMADGAKFCCFCGTKAYVESDFEENPPAPSKESLLPQKEVIAVENKKENIPLPVMGTDKNLIKCPDCGRMISAKAKTCIGCGCPIIETSTKGMVRIKMPSNIVEGWVGLFSSRNASVKDERGNTLWQGQHGENAKFEVDGSTKITINLGGWANEVSGTVQPRCKYALVQDMGVHMLATFRLTEVDVIDSD